LQKLLSRSKTLVSGRKNDVARYLELITNKYNNNQQEPEKGV